MNREQWLTEVAGRIVDLYRERGVTVGAHRLTCGWPCRNALGKRVRRIGECHAVESSKAGLSELFISPSIDDPLQVAGTICHELIHVAVGVKQEHNSVFVEACRKVGLTKGRPTQVMPGKRLEPVLSRIVEAVGPYPHAALEPVGIKKPKKDSPLVKLVCTCGCSFRVNSKWLVVGMPACVCGAEMRRE